MMSFDELLNNFRHWRKVMWLIMCIPIAGLLLLLSGLISISDNALYSLFSTFGGFGLIFIFVILAFLLLSKNRKLQDIYEKYVKELLAKHIKEMNWKGFGAYGHDCDKLLVNPFIIRQSSFTGTFKDADMYFYDLTHRENIDANRSKIKVTKGQYYELTSPYAVEIPIRIAAMRGKRHSVFLTKQANENRVDLESMQFNKEFEIYTPQEVNGFYVLNPLVMEKLLVLKQKYGEFIIHFHQNKIQCFIKTNRHILTLNMDILRDKDFTLKDIEDEIIGITETLHDVHNSLSKSVVK